MRVSTLPALSWPQYVLLFVWPLAGLAACSPPADDAGSETQETRAAEPGEAEAELRHVAEVIINDNFAGNRIDPIEPHIAEDVAVFGPGGRFLRIGKEPMMESLRQAATEKVTSRWEERDWHVQVYGEIGIVSFIYDHEGVRGGQPYSRTSRATYVFHRRDGRWQLVHDHTSALPPAPGGQTSQ